MQISLFGYDFEYKWCTPYQPDRDYEIVIPYVNQQIIYCTWLWVLHSQNWVILVIQGQVRGTLYLIYIIVPYQIPHMNELWHENPVWDANTV